METEMSNAVEEAGAVDKRAAKVSALRASAAVLMARADDLAAGGSGQTAGERFCVDCRHYYNGTEEHFHKGAPVCIHPLAPRDPVSGSQYLSCFSLRSETRRPYCGESAAWFELRESLP